MSRAAPWSRGRWPAVGAALAVVVVSSPAFAAPSPATPSPEAAAASSPAPTAPGASDDADAGASDDTVDDTAAPPVAPTPEAPAVEGNGPDEVATTSGAVLLGLVTEEVPQSHVTIIVGGSGQVRTIPWAEVASVDRGKHAEDRVEPGTTAAPGRPLVHLHTKGPSGVSLYRAVPSPSDADGSAATDREVCAAPCDVVVDGRRGEEFVVGGRGLTRSQPFTLIEAASETTIQVRVGRTGLRLAGWIVGSIGAAAVIGGALTLTLADDDDTLRKGGGYTFLAGLPLVAGGAVMIAFGRTRVQFVTPADASAAAAKGGGRRSAR